MNKAVILGGGGELCCRNQNLAEKNKIKIMNLQNKYKIRAK